METVSLPPPTPVVFLVTIWPEDESKAANATATVSSSETNRVHGQTEASEIVLWVPSEQKAQGLMLSREEMRSVTAPTAWAGQRQPR